jgi:nucleoside-diphosphate-sugar epimerase
MASALDRRPVRLTPPGFAHDWIYVGDVVEACVRAATCGEGAADGSIDGEILNVATGDRTSNERILEMVEQLSGHSIARAGDPFPARSWDTAAWVADTAKTARLLGWRAPTPVHEGLAQTMRWFAAHLDLYRSRIGE